MLTCTKSTLRLPKEGGGRSALESEEDRRCFTADGCSTRSGATGKGAVVVIVVGMALPIGVVAGMAMQIGVVVGVAPPTGAAFADTGVARGSDEGTPPSKSDSIIVCITFLSNSLKEVRVTVRGPWMLADDNSEDKEGGKIGLIVVFLCLCLSFAILLRFGLLVNIRRSSGSGYS